MPKLTTTPSTQVQHQIRAHQHKRRAERRQGRENETVRQENFLQRLPVEILAEILSYSSLRTVLAVSRSCKWLCTTLTHPDQSFIWKNARKRLSPPPPDPPYDITEPAYAAIIYSVGNCPVCNARQTGPPLVFQHRAHFCHTETKYCRGRLNTSGGHPLIYLSRASSWTISDEGHLERTSDGHVILPEGDDFDDSFVWRAERDRGIREWDSAQGNPEVFDALLKRWSKRAERMPELRKHDVEWGLWVAGCRGRTEFRQEHLEIKTKQTAKRLGCEGGDLLKSRTFNALVKLWEREGGIRFDVWEPYEAQIREELGKNKAIHERRKAEHERSLKQVYVEAFHAAAIQSLFPANSTSPTTSQVPVLPTLESYRSLPSISNIIHNASIPSKGLRKKLRTDETLRTMIKADLEKEDARLRKVMSVRLGVKKNWKPPTPGEQGSKDGGASAQHPLDRLTALFECTRCQSDLKGMPAGHGEYTVLSFEAAVRHRCPRYLPNTQGGAGGAKAKNGRANWDAENFVPDTTGIAVVKLALGLAELNEETTTRKDVDGLGRRWQCLTCPSNVTMSFGAVVGHAKRHKAMSQRSSKSTNDVSTSLAPSSFSFSLNFIPKPTPLPPNLPTPLAPDATVPHSKSQKAKESRVEYGCRHCGFSRIFGNAGGQPSAGGYTPKRFSVDGLASHVLRKHGLAPLRNEDLWVFNAGDEDETSENGPEERTPNPYACPEERTPNPYAHELPTLTYPSHFFVYSPPLSPESVILWPDDDTDEMD
ncbi:hypothetical protein FRC05_005382 [Tulasnella sp. 425]|nr:hypothetical protein FRC05_005382 [Tulasnella sp. 425]